MKVSIITVTYNRRDLLKQTVDSILSQNYREFEYIIVDNFSVDGTVDMLTQLAQKDSRVKFLQHKHVGKLYPQNMNYALQFATGKYIAFCDSDDLWMPDKLEKQVAYMEAHPECGACGTNGIKFNELGEETPYYEQLPSDDDLTFLGFLTNCWLIQSSSMIRNDVLKKIGGCNESPAIYPADDYDMWLRITGSGYKIGFLKDYLVRYRVHSGSVSLPVDYQWVNLMVYAGLAPMIQRNLNAAEQRLFEGYVDATRLKIKYYDYNQVLLKWLRDYEEITSNILLRVHEYKRVILYGCGEVGRLILLILQKNAVPVRGFVDQNCREKEYRGVKVYSSIEELNIKDSIILITVSHSEDQQIKAEILAKDKDGTILTVREIINT